MNPGPDRVADLNLQSLPNTLTLGRIIAVPLFVALFYWGGPWGDPLAALVFILAAVTDWIDGYLARKLGVTTPLGEFLDPVADKLMVAIALILLVAHDHEPVDRGLGDGDRRPRDHRLGAAGMDGPPRRAGQGQGVVARQVEDHRADGRASA